MSQMLLDCSHQEFCSRVSCDIDGWESPESFETVAVFNPLMLLLMEEILHHLIIVNLPICVRLLYIPGGCLGLLPSTVVPSIKLTFLTQHLTTKYSVEEVEYSFPGRCVEWWPEEVIEKHPTIYYTLENEHAWNPNHVGLVPDDFPFSKIMWFSCATC